jgi:hypothetical protein
MGRRAWRRNGTREFWLGRLWKGIRNGQWDFRNGRFGKGNWDVEVGAGWFWWFWWFWRW